jgi:hypothetical protein
MYGEAECIPPLRYAPPDFLWNLVALAHSMLLSLTKSSTRGFVQRSVAGNPVPVGMTIHLGNDT